MFFFLGVVSHGKIKKKKVKKKSLKYSFFQKFRIFASNLSKAAKQDFL